MQDLATLSRRAFDVLVNNELSPSTRDLVTVEGLPVAEWADGDGERVGLLDVILSEYEAAAVAEGNYDAVRAILAVRADCKPEPPPKVRKQTKMEFCDRHRDAFLSSSVYRRVEVMVEGGWASGGPCEGGRCKLYPGRDYICRDTCEQYGMGEMPLDWTTEPDDEPGDIIDGELADAKGRPDVTHPAAASVPGEMSPRRREAFVELNAAGWPSIADDVHDGTAAETILGRLRDIGQADTDAYEIVSRLADDELDELFGES